MPEPEEAPKIYHPFDSVEWKDGQGLPNESTIQPLGKTPPPNPTASTNTPEGVKPDQSDQKAQAPVKDMAPEPPRPTRMATRQPSPPIDLDIVVGRPFSFPLFFFTLLMIFLTSLGLYSYFNLQPKLRNLSLAKEIEEPVQNLISSLRTSRGNFSQLEGLDIQIMDKETTQILDNFILGADKSLLTLEENLKFLQDQISMDSSSSNLEITSLARLLSQRTENLTAQLQKLLEDYHRVTATQISPETAENRLKEARINWQEGDLVKEIESLTTSFETFHQQINGLKNSLKIPFLD